MRLLPGCQQARHRLTEAGVLAGTLTPELTSHQRRNDMTTTVSRERPQSTKEMLAVHRVFRRESALMPRLAQAVRRQADCCTSGPGRGAVEQGPALEQNGHEPYACHAHANPGPARPACVLVGELTGECRQPKAE